MTKTCVICHAPFEPLRPTRLTCSEACRREQERRHRKVYDASPERKRLRNARDKAVRADNPPSPRSCRTSRHDVASRAHDTTPPPMGTCKQCNAPFKPRHGTQIYCSSACRERPLPLRLTCEQCNGPIAQPSPKRRYCSGSCRKASHMAKFESTALDYEGEILVADLESAPKRLALAKMFDKFESTGNFYHGPTSPAWINPNDKRASR